MLWIQIKYYEVLSKYYKKSYEFKTDVVNFYAKRYEFKAIERVHNVHTEIAIYIVAFSLEEEETFKF